MTISGTEPKDEFMALTGSGHPEKLSAEIFRRKRKLRSDAYTAVLLQAQDLHASLFARLKFITASST